MSYVLNFFGFEAILLYYAKSDWAYRIQWVNIYGMYVLYVQGICTHRLSHTGSPNPWLFKAYSLPLKSFTCTHRFTYTGNPNLVLFFAYSLPVKFFYPKIYINIGEIYIFCLFFQCFYWVETKNVNLVLRIPSFQSCTWYTINLVLYFVYHHFNPVLGTSFGCNTWYLILIQYLVPHFNPILGTSF